MSERVSSGARHSFTVPVLSATLGKFDVKVFIAEAKKVAPYCIVSKRDTDSPDAYQQIFLESRVRKIEEFINDGNPILPAIVLASGFGEAPCYSPVQGGRSLAFRPIGDSLFVVDGQHRLRGAAQTSTKLVFVIAEQLAPKDQAHQFVVINQEAHRIPTSLLKDLLPGLADYFDVEEPQQKVRDIAVRLSDDPNSVLFEKVERFKQNVPGKVSLANFDRKWRPHFTAAGVLGMDTIDEAYPVIRDYFGSIKASFPAEWTSPKGNPFLKTVVFGAFSMIFPTAYRLATGEGDGADVKSFSRVFEGLQGIDIMGLLSFGTGQAAEKVMANELLLALRR